MNKEIWEVLTAIIDGYHGKVEDGFIIVENPDFQEDNGTNPNLVIKAADLLMLLDPR